MGMIYTEIEQYKIWLKNNLTEERYLHSLGTAEVAKELALSFNIDVKKAELAGLIHDCAKCLDKDALLDLMKNCKTLSAEELNNIKTYHAPAGEVLAQKEFGIVDEEILSAIRWHTIGKIGMSDFDKIIFIADKIETKTRPQEWAFPIREALNIGLDNAMLCCFSNTIKSLVDRKLYICTSTIDIYNDILVKISK